ncbi:MAG: glycosyltransferase [Cyanobacteria bacterium REEB65]|nr:glycosyltransferase [Cyanobacteria bacterium REEB65]
MRVVFVTSTLPCGPQEGFLYAELAAFCRQGHDVRIVPMAPRGPVIHEEGRALLDCAVLRPWVSPAILSAALVETIGHPVACARLLARLLLASRNLRIAAKNLAIWPKGLWFARWLQKQRPDHLHACWAGAVATMAWIAAERNGISWSFAAHRWDLYENNALPLKGRSAQFVRAISEKGACDLAAAIGPLGRRPMVLHVGVETAAGAPLRQSDGPLRILMAANFVEVKAHPVLIAALEILRARSVPFRCDLAGTGPLEPAIRNLVQHCGLTEEYVRFLGALAHEDLLDRMGRGDYDTVVLTSIVTPSGEHEGIPITLVEAMMRGIPVVGTRTGSIPELLDGDCGILLEPGDSAALAAALERLARDTRLREQLAVAGRSRALGAYSVEPLVASLAHWMATPGIMPAR